MSPRGRKAKRTLAENLVKEVEKQEVPATTVEVKPAVTSAQTIEPFIKVEEYKPVGQLDAVFLDEGLAKMYALSWQKKAVLGSNRVGIWHVVDKKHPHFTSKVLSVQADHTPDKSYYSVDELVLCVARQETIKQRDDELRRITSGKYRGFEESFKEDTGKALASGGYDAKREPTFGRIKETRGQSLQSANFR
jgi:hypothetical protein